MSLACHRSASGRRSQAAQLVPAAGLPAGLFPIARVPIVQGPVVRRAQPPERPAGLPRLSHTAAA